MKRRDFSGFVAQNWKKYIMVIILVLIQCRFFEIGVEQYAQIKNTEYKLSVSDYVIEFFKSTLPYTFSGKKEAFNIPPILSLYVIYYFVLIGKSVSDLSTPFQIQCTLRRGSRKRWWYRQSLNIWLETIGYLFITFLTFLVYGICSGARFSWNNVKLHLEYNGMDTSKFAIIPNIILTSLFILTALAYIQYVISLRGNVFLGIVISTIIWICSVFHWNPLLLGNYLMVRRYEPILEGGANCMTGIGMSAGIILLMFLAGCYITKTKDLF
ncbi:hypothetical protein [Mediterraneibacter gnavus]|uniref:hypothetical protein n=1 Tax=Mediterraneibacter gnavus TaxID=33038 RepID=UPI00232E6B1E|nr:hypothetical protein [Mediterraneibacter gnavus]MDB8711884.1 hypothetical protein [Mediterraneibacter gnavus]MDB8714921.1 hypothetical protein [Mediterraneibacter gnavus]